MNAIIVLISDGVILVKFQKLILIAVVSVRVLNFNDQIPWHKNFSFKKTKSVLAFI